MEPTKWLSVFLLLLPTFVSANPERIIGGQECKRAAHPWLVVLHTADKHFCSAILLNHKWVVSAAHCHSSDQPNLVLGMHNFKVRTGHEQWRKGVSSICYPDTSNSISHTSCSMSRDIMLIKLDRPVDYSEYIAPIDLPYSPAPPGKDCTVMGWGSITPDGVTSSIVPRCLDIQVYRNSICNRVYQRPVTNDMLCAGVLEGGQGSCKGDSGGPLLCGGVLQGIVSFGNVPCAAPQELAVYTKVHSYRDWIRSIIQ